MDRPVAGIVPLSVSVVAGVLSWDLVRLFGDRGEAWDDAIYWQLAFPRCCSPPCCSAPHVAIGLGAGWRP